MATYMVNHGGHAVCGDIVELLEAAKEGIPSADLVIGGPPCQGFSLLNKNRVDDPRREMWRPYLEVVRRSGASLFVIENVPQLLGSDEHREIIFAAQELGFTTRSAKLLAADYGVPQVRWRAFIVGCRFADPAAVFPPKRTHYNPAKQAELHFDDYVANPQPWRTVRDAIADLPPPEGTEIRDVAPPLNLHFGRSPTPTSVERRSSLCGPTWLVA